MVLILMTSFYIMGLFFYFMSCSSTLGITVTGWLLIPRLMEISMCMHIFGVKGPVTLEGTIQAPPFRNHVCSPQQCCPRLCSALSPDMSFFAVCNDSSNRLGDADEQTVKRVIIL